VGEVNQEWVGNNMNFVTLLIIILASTVIISVMRSIQSTDEFENEHPYRDERSDQDLQSDTDSVGVPIAPGNDLGSPMIFLPEEFWEYFLHPRDEPYIIPQKNSAVGEVRVMFVWGEVIVAVGTHTELRFDSADRAFEFLGKVLRDEIVFRIGYEESIICPIEDIEGPGEADRNDYVWSGPLKHKLLFRY
jgi:hypothetical protein